MPMSCVPITETSQVAAARRTALQMASSVGLPETETGALALVVTEAATNLVKHAHAGQLLLRTLEAAEGPGVELLALDTGPGMVHVAQCLRMAILRPAALGPGSAPSRVWPRCGTCIRSLGKARPCSRRSSTERVASQRGQLHRAAPGPWQSGSSACRIPVKQCVGMPGWSPSRRSAT